VAAAESAAAAGAAPSNERGVESSEMTSLIPLINKLQDAMSILGNGTSIDLPQIAVVGSQSAGKSSVLENIVGKSFLPRGSGIVTRRPCVVQLIHDTEEYGMFLHQHGRRFYNFADVCSEIEAETSRLCGSNYGLSTQPINLQIHSPNVVNLTLVDLPGSVLNPVGDQPASIVSDIESMLLSYIGSPNTIILAISAANADLATSSALSLARRVDPHGERTLGVLTKVDLMDDGTDASLILQQRDPKVPSLPLGYVAVVNRSQRDIQEKVDIIHARESEMRFFKQHPAYSPLVHTCCTTPLLVKKLVTLLQSRIRAALPGLRTAVGDMLREQREALAALPASDMGSKKRKLVELVLGFSETFRSLLKPNAADNAAEDGVFVIAPGAMIERIFTLQLPQDMRAVDALHDVSKKQNIQVLVENVKGLGGGLFLPDQALTSILRTSVRRLEEPAQRCCSSVLDQLVQLAEKCSEKMRIYELFPSLALELTSRAKELIHDSYVTAAAQISTMVAMETSRIDLSHEDFIGSKVNMAQLYNEASQDVSGARIRPNRRRNPSSDVQQQQQQQQQLQGAQQGGSPTNGQQQQQPKRGLFQRLGGGGGGDQGQGASPPPPPQQQQSLSQLAEGEETTVSLRQDGGSGNYAGNRQSMVLSNPKLLQAVQDLPPERVVEIELLVRLVTNYFSIITKQLTDTVPKAVVLLLVNASTEAISKRLLEELTGDEMVDQLMSVGEGVAQKRQELEQAITLLEDVMRAMEAIQRGAVA